MTEVLILKIKTKFVNGESSTGARKYHRPPCCCAIKYRVLYIILYILMRCGFTEIAFNSNFWWETPLVKWLRAPYVSLYTCMLLYAKTHFMQNNLCYVSNLLQLLYVRMQGLVYNCALYPWWTKGASYWKWPGVFKSRLW